jgi:hypothetical protein
LFTKKSLWQAKQSIPHTTLTFYGDCIKILKDFAPNFGDEGMGCASRQSNNSHVLNQGMFDKKKHTVFPTTLLFSVFLIEDNTERQPF